MNNDQIISWLLNGDVSVQYQTYRDLLGADKPELRARIKSEGWGKQFLSHQRPDGQWGAGFYNPKWTSTHYTLLDLRNLEINPENRAIRGAVQSIFDHEKGSDGGINPARTIGNSDVCINGMVMNYSCYFKVKENDLRSVVDFLLSQKMSDGGFNCRSNRSGAVHSSLHTTLSVLEGILEYKTNGYTYRLDELKQAEKDAIEFILIHRLFRSDKTGKVIHSDFLRFHNPPRWRYNILKAMDYFQKANVRYDNRMQDAIEVIRNKRTKDGQWKLAAKYPGKVHFDMEKAGKPSRWNTLRALRVLRYYETNPAD